MEKVSITHLHLTFIWENSKMDWNMEKARNFCHRKHFILDLSLMVCRKVMALIFCNQANHTQEISSKVKSTEKVFGETHIGLNGMTDHTKTIKNAGTESTVGQMVILTRENLKMISRTGKVNIIKLKAKRWKEHGRKEFSLLSQQKIRKYWKIQPIQPETVCNSNLCTIQNQNL